MKRKRSNLKIRLNLNNSSPIKKKLDLFRFFYETKKNLSQKLISQIVNRMKIIIVSLLSILIITSFASGFACDSGDDETTCYINTTQVLNGSVNFNNLVIQSGGVLTHSANTISQTYYLNITCVNLTIESNGSIDVTGKGYNGGTNVVNGYGPGGGISYTGGVGNRGGSGASYGGRGARGNFITTMPASYGNITTSMLLGSGGGGSWSATGGKGGGLIIINATNKITINGNIIATGKDGTNGTATQGTGAGGSGGSIFIITNNITGTGNITANGGNSGYNGASQYGGGGAGGRIAIYYNTNTYEGMIINKGGNGYAAGGAGTSYLKSSLETYGGIMINNYEYTTAITNITENITLNWANFTNTTIQGININKNPINITNELNIMPGIVYLHSPIIGTSQINILNESTLTHTANTNTQKYFLNLTCENITIESDGSIDVTGKGYSGGTNVVNGYGPGGGISYTGGVGNTGGSAASYGGRGARGQNIATIANTYGNIQTPTTIGSGGGGAYSATGGKGGGLIIINATNKITINGNIIATGKDGTNGTTNQGTGAGGSGGSIFIITNNITGTGNITANGGNSGYNGASQYGGGGAGGRIFLNYNDNSNTINIIVTGGIGYATGGEGSIFECNHMSGFSCPGTYEGITLTTNFIRNYTININRSLQNTWTTDDIRWNDSSSLTAENATYTFTGLTSSTYYKLFKDDIYNQTANTNESGTLILTNVPIGTSTELKLLQSNTMPTFEVSFNGSDNRIVTYPNEDLICKVNANDSDDSTVTAYYIIYLNDSVYETNSTTIIPNNTWQLIKNISSSITEPGDNWTCSVIVGDSYVNASQQNKSIIITNLFLELSLDLEPNTITINQNVALSGHLNYSNGSDIGNNALNIYVNDTQYYLDTDTDVLEVITPAWWDSSWKYRTEINITSLVSTNLNNTIALIKLLTSELISQSKMNSDCGDTKFIDNDGNELQYTMETSTCNTSNTIYWVWINLTGNANTTIYAYYGNGAASLPTDYINPDDSLVLYAHFDNSVAYGESPTKTFDFSRNGNNGTVTGASWNDSTVYGGGFTFDGSSNYYISIPGYNTDFTTQNFTILAWVYPNTNDAGMIYDNRYEIQSTDSGWMFGLFSSGRLDFDINGDNDNAVTLSPVDSYSAGAWQLVGVTKSGSTGIFYVDGNNVSTSSLGTSSTIRYDPAAHHLIGKVGDIYYDHSYNIPNRYFDGTITEIRIYDKALSKDEIQGIYNATMNHYIKNNSLLASTDADGNYNYTFMAPSEAGEYEIKVNTSYDGMSAENTKTLFVQNPSEGINCTAYKCFILRADGSPVAIFDALGRLDIKGNLHQNSVGSPNANDFIIRNSTGSSVLWIDDTTGDLSMIGTLSENNDVACIPSSGSFFIRGNNSECVVYVNNTGDLWIKGDLREESLT